jgi:hypothetical protein
MIDNKYSNIQSFIKEKNFKKYEAQNPCNQENFVN